MAAFQAVVCAVVCAVLAFVVGARAATPGPALDLAALAEEAFASPVRDGDLGAPISFWVQRFVNASREYQAAGELDQGLHVRGATYFHEPTKVFDVEEAALGLPEDVFCFRIPAVMQTASGRLLAFAEGRVGSCSDCVVTGIAAKTSDDGGRTWGDLRWVVPPTPTANGTKMDVGANPTAVFDKTRNRTLLHFVRGSADGTDCIPGTHNFQIVSADDGETWGASQDLSPFLGDFVGCLPGPGTGVQLERGARHRGRMLVACHYQTAERSDGRVVVYYTDDGGDTYQLADSYLPAMDESTLTEAPDGSVVVNMRNDPWVTQSGCNCRAVARSTDGGSSFGAIEFDAALVDPVCEGSLATVGNLVLFSNPPMKYARANLTVHVSTDNGATWPSQIRIADSAALSDYSSLVQGTLQRGGETNVGGVLFGSCAAPIPFRPWCMLRRAWNVYFTRFPLGGGALT